MRRSVPLLLVVAALAIGCSATSDPVGIGGGDGSDCPEGKECEENPINDGEDSDEDDGSDDEGESDEDENSDGTNSDSDGTESDEQDGNDDGQADRDAGPPPVGAECEVTDIIPEGCIAATTSESALDLCDGSDNDCDGLVDEGCVCTPGTVQRCFAGPPGRRGVGGCDDGQQTCVGTEFGKWGDCTGGIVPSDEVCDSLDNDCNGCIDEIDDCIPDLACPAPGDPRIPDGKPFSSYALVGSDFVADPDTVVSWQWSVTGTPCDAMFLAIPGSAASATNGQLSFTLSNATSRNANVSFTLSGDYTVTMKVKLQDGSEIECTWVVHVRAPGVRVELCWDTTGPTSAGNPIDVDLHLGKHGTTARWFDSMDCHYLYSAPNWGYAPTAITNCSGPGSNGTFSGSCPNPRLDIDNVVQPARYVPENINVDDPANGDKFRVMVHHYDFAENFDTHPLVNVYCGGELRGTFGAFPNQITGFRDGRGMPSVGDMWRVVDVTAQVDGSGVTTACNLEPLSVDGSPWVTTDDPSF